MNADNIMWQRSRRDLVEAVTELGFPEELGNEIAKNLGSPKAMYRMTVYLKNVRPKKAEMVVDEMLAIKEEIEAWRRNKEAREAQASYYAMRYDGFGDDEEE